jgi:hypothetical protein
MFSQNVEHFFKPEARASGRSLVTQGKVSFQRPSDTEIVSYIRASTSFKVSLKSPSVSDSTINVDCTCPQSKKGQFCKHIWATLLAVEAKDADFFDSKTEIEKRTAGSIEKETKSKLTDAQVESRSAFAKKQADYRKEQYQKQKQRQKDFKNSKKESTDQPQLPTDVERALQFFLDNGFPLRESLSKSAVNLAMKKLARIFHPDVGGSHQEIVALNLHTDILIEFAKN